MRLGVRKAAIHYEQAGHMKLNSRVMLVTGSSKGIGAAIAIEAARAGANVIVNYHADEEGARQTLQSIEESK